jgi:hypothetical protein
MQNFNRLLILLCSFIMSNVFANCTIYIHQDFNLKSSEKNIVDEVTISQLPKWGYSITPELTKAQYVLKLEIDIALNENKNFTYKVFSKLIRKNGTESLHTGQDYKLNRAVMKALTAIETCF